ncbi:hypothetical protein PF010_g6443 [Phytophthora fragariae]|nr:hypothetical protein PF003_g38638 [Phytophthora fragariae]KAE8944743.1 hypothetical protein PF009_g5584 [Phytophthora fragariae]KAE9123322.1 hypothetical protein PF010_g6443 [Phytophthora fragariae]KAE9128457.1 hypothetical protein PF007_g5255 [Phytophthora fragariae]KAE9149556.1 hypothetical protein PF006_g5960 [Phytophthora fragariae]
MATSYNPQHVVLGTDGTVVVGVDPSLYFRRAKTQIYRHHDQLESEQPSRLVEFDSELHDPKETEAEELPLATLPVVYDELPDTYEIDSSIQEIDEDEFSSSAVFQDTASSVSWTTFAVTEGSEIPGVYGSVIFAELSCCFVAFIGYLVRSIPLWVGFSRSQKCCLVVAFSLAFLYQFAALGWLFGTVTPELMLGLSSVITRMISLGMVPITTTSFMGRAREICQP